MDENLKKNRKSIEFNFVFYLSQGKGRKRSVDMIDHYLRLRLKFSNVADGESCASTTGELADCLCCTMRNMNLIMNRFMREGWVEWSPERGRGKKSKLVFRYPLRAAAGERFEQLMQGNRLDEAYELASRLPFAIRNDVLQRLGDHFGFRSAVGSEGRMDTLRIPQETPFVTLDPTQVAMWAEAGIVGEVFDRLVRYNAERERCEPSLAIAWESNAAGTEWTFYLHKGVRFHHGKSLDAEDVKYTFERIAADRSNPCRWLFGDIAGIVAYDELTVRFRLSRPHFMFPDLMSSIAASILPRDVDFDPLNPVGTGPYRLVRNDPQLLALDVNPWYFKGRAYIDRVELWQLPRLPSGEPLVESAIKRDMFPDGQGRAVQYEAQGGVFMTFNMRKPGPQQDRRFRLAIRYLLSRQALNNEMGDKNTRIAYSLFRGRLEEQSAMSPMDDEGVDGSLARAATLLRDSGYAGETVSVWVEDGHKLQIDMAWFADRCERVGLKINIVPGDVVKAVYHHDFGEHDLIYTGELFDEHVMLSLLTMYTFRNTLFLIAMDDAWRAALALQCSRVVGIRDEDERMQGWIELEEMLIREALLLPMYSFREEHTHHASLRDYRVVGYGMPDLRRLWVKRSPDAESRQESYPAYIPLW